MTDDDVTADLDAAAREVLDKAAEVEAKYAEHYLLAAARVARAYLALAPVRAECQRFAAAADSYGDAVGVCLSARFGGAGLTLGDVRRAAGGGV